MPGAARPPIPEGGGPPRKRQRRRAAWWSLGATCTVHGTALAIYLLAPLPPPTLREALLEVELNTPRPLQPAPPPRATPMLHHAQPAHERHAALPRPSRARPTRVATPEPVPSPTAPAVVTPTPPAPDVPTPAPTAPAAAPTPVPTAAPTAAPTVAPVATAPPPRPPLTQDVPLSPLLPQTRPHHARYVEAPLRMAQASHRPARPLPLQQSASGSASKSFRNSAEPEAGGGDRAAAAAGGRARVAQRAPRAQPAAAWAFGGAAGAAGSPASAEAPSPGQHFAQRLAESEPAAPGALGGHAGRLPVMAGAPGGGRAAMAEWAGLAGGRDPLLLPQAVPRHRGHGMQGAPLFFAQNPTGGAAAGAEREGLPHSPGILAPGASGHVGSGAGGHGIAENNGADGAAHGRGNRRLALASGPGSGSGLAGNGSGGGSGRGFGTRRGSDEGEAGAGAGAGGRAGAGHGGTSGTGGARYARRGPISDPWGALGGAGAGRGRGGGGSGDGVGNGFGSQLHGPGGVGNGTRLAELGPGEGAGGGAGERRGHGAMGFGPGWGGGGTGNAGGGKSGRSGGDALAGGGSGHGGRRAGHSRQERDYGGGNAIGRGLYPDGLMGRYYQDADLSDKHYETQQGRPIDWPVFTQLKMTRLDRSLNFQWGAAAPDPRLPNVYWSARWSGRIFVPKDDIYVFSFDELDDGGKLILDGVTIIDVWQVQKSSPSSGKMTLKRGPHQIVVEYVQGPATESSMALMWQSSSFPREVVGAYVDGAVTR